MRILRTHGRHGHAAVRPRAHRARGEARNAAALRDPQFRRAGTALDRSFHASLGVLGLFRLNKVQFSGGVTRNTHRQARHVVRHVEGMLALRRLHGAIASRLHTLFCLRLESPAIGGAAPGKFLQLLLHRVAGLRGGLGGSRGFLAAA